MARGRLSKNDIIARIYKLKTHLYDGKESKRSEEWHNGAHHAYNTILDILNEYNQ